MACDFKAIIANSRALQTELAKLNTFEQIVALYSLTCQYAKAINPGLNCDPIVRSKDTGCLRCFGTTEILALNASLLCDTTAGGCTVPNVLTTTLPGGLVGDPYGEKMHATLDNVSWKVASGTLPPGVTLDSYGEFHGTPTTAGTFNFTVEASNACGVDSQAESIVIAASCTAPVITTAATVTAVVGAFFQLQNTATGTGPFTWTLASGTMPPGLELDAVSGLISGTPTTTGSSVVTFRATNACGNNTKAVTITVTNTTIYWGNFQAPVPGSFTVTQIKALSGRGGGTRATNTRAGNYDFAANGPPPEHQVIWIPDVLLPPTATGSLSITAQGLAIPLNPAPNTPYQSLAVDGAPGKVFVTGNANGGGFNTAGGNPMVIA